MRQPCPNPACDAVFTVTPDMAGRRMSCGKCGSAFVVGDPGRGPPLPPAPATFGQLPLDEGMPPPPPRSARLKLPVTFIVISNAVYGWIKAGQKSGYGQRYFSVDFGVTDHAKVAEAYGVRG